MKTVLVRKDKGSKYEIATLPESLKTQLQLQLKKVRATAANGRPGSHARPLLICHPVCRKRRKEGTLAKEKFSRSRNLAAKVIFAALQILKEKAVRLPARDVIAS